MLRNDTYSYVIVVHKQTRMEVFFKYQFLIIFKLLHEKFSVKIKEILLRD